MRKVDVIRLEERDFFGKVLTHNMVVVSDSEGVTMIDTSLPENFEALTKEAKKLGIQVEDVSRLVLTHSHPDHIGNAELIRRTAHAKVFAHSEESFAPGVFNLDFEEVRSEIPVSMEEFRSTLKRINDMKIELPRIDVRLNGGEEISGFRVIHTPGHTPGHIALFDGETLVTGDAVRMDCGMKPPLRFFNWDHEQAVRSFQHLISLPYKRVIPYHG